MEIIKPKLNFRGDIKSKSYNYYIINEIMDRGDMKVFTACQWDLVRKEKKFKNEKFCIKYLTKNWIRKNILVKLELDNEKEGVFFEGLEKSSMHYRDIGCENVQNLHDFIQDDEGVYIVTEILETSLKEYVSNIKDSLKNFSSFPFEIKVRKLIYQVLEAVTHLHDKKNIFYGGLLNIQDIFVEEKSTLNKQVNVIVKFPTPFMSEIFTIFFLQSKTYFPSHYSPEIYRLFEMDKIIEKKYSFDFSNLMNKICQNMDMWSLGCLIYEMLYDGPPFNFKDLNDAKSSLTEDTKYKVYHHRISKNCLCLLIKCIQYNIHSRMDSLLLSAIKKSIQRENVNLDELETMLNKQIQENESEQNKGIEFDIVSDNNNEEIFKLL